MVRSVALLLVAIAVLVVVLWVSTLGAGGTLPTCSGLGTANASACK